MAECFDLLGYLDGTIAAPSPTITAAGADAPNPAYTEWRKKDKKLLGVLFTSLTAEAMSEVVDATSTFDAWNALENLYAQASESRAYQLRQDLLSLCRNDSYVEDYGRKFKTLSDQLSGIGRPVPKADKSHWFLSCLGVQFASFADTCMAFTPVSPFHDLLHQAKQYELLLHAMEGAPPANAAFTVARDGNRRSDRNTGRR